MSDHLHVPVHDDAANILLEALRIVARQEETEWVDIKINLVRAIMARAEKVAETPTPAEPEKATEPAASGELAGTVVCQQCTARVKIEYSMICEECGHILCLDCYSGHHHEDPA